MTSRRRALLTVVLIAVAAWLLAAVVALAVLRSGLYDVGADRPHTQSGHSLLEIAMRQSVRRQARTLEERPAASTTTLQRGATCYIAHCLACHGAPGVAPQPLALGMQALPGPLVDVNQHWRQRELVWIVRHGIRMSGMPSWRGRLADDDIHAVVAFLQHLPLLTPAAYVELARQTHDEACSAAVGGPPVPVAERVDAGRDAVRRYGCQRCHHIPGLVGSRPQVGPTLDGFARRPLIAGRLPHTPENLIAWLQDPQAIDPQTAMPSLGIGRADAEAIAAYLASLR